MAIPCFFYPELTLSDVNITLSGTEASHALNARRLRVGDHVRLLNGCGVVADGTINTVERRELSVAIDDFQQYSAPVQRLTIATAIPKGDRQRTLVDMVTQLGVSNIVPIHCDRSVTKYSEKLREKWQRSAVESCKQSHNPWLPTIDAAVTFNEYVTQLDGAGAYASASGRTLAEVAGIRQSMCIIVGPEGGFSDAELSVLEHSDLSPVTLGNNILRTETAAVAVASLWSQLQHAHEHT